MAITEAPARINHVVPALELALIEARPCQGNRSVYEKVVEMR